MFHCLPSRLAVAAAALLAAAAQAQPQPKGAAPARPDPLDPKAAVPALAYRSAFDGYRAATVPEVGSWPQANDTVGRIGGWRAYAREATAPATPSTPAAAPSAPRKP